MQLRVIFVFGPTSSGKTALSLEIAAYLKNAHSIDAEVINADSRQVYKGMTVGTNKVSGQARKATPHHLIDVATPNREYVAADFAREAPKIIQAVVGRGHMPLVVGGTGTFVNALVGDRYIANKPVAYESLLLVPAFERSLLYGTIEAAVDEMFRKGLYGELKQLAETYDGVPKMAGKTIGYREFVEYAKAHGKNIFRLSTNDLEKIKQAIKKDTKSYAMHQIGWLDKMHGYQMVKNSQQAKQAVDNFLAVERPNG